MESLTPHFPLIKTETPKSKSHFAMSALAAVRIAPAPERRHVRSSIRGKARRVAATSASVPASGAELLSSIEIDSPGWSGGYGTGGKVWSSSRVLCDFLVDVAAGVEDCGGFEFQGVRVVELGSGTGVVGIACAALGASTVVLTDGGSKSLLKLSEENAAKNIGKAKTIDPEATTMTVSGYKWGQSPLPAKLANSAPYDLIIGSDCTYAVGGHGALCDAIVDLTKCGDDDEKNEKNDPSKNDKNEPCVILAHQHRTLAAALAGRGSKGWGVDPNLTMFIETAKKRGLKVEEIRVTKLAWHGLRNVSVLLVTRRAREEETTSST